MVKMRHVTLRLSKGTASGDVGRSATVPSSKLRGRPDSKQFFCVGGGVTMGLRTGLIVPQFADAVLNRTFLDNTGPIIPQYTGTVPYSVCRAVLADGVRSTEHSAPEQEHWSIEHRSTGALEHRALEHRPLS